MQEQSLSQTYDGKRHDVMIVTSVLLSTPPCLVPVPAFDSAIVRSGQDDRQSWMNGDASDVILMGLPCVDTLAGRDGVHPGHEVIYEKA